MPDLAKQRRRSRIEAVVLDAGAKMTHKTFGLYKTGAIGPMTGTVVELGPGTGANMRYYSPGVHVIGIEPNPHMHDRLRRRVAEHGVDLEIRSLRGESIDVENSSADAVVATLVLCGVDNAERVLTEVRRVLRPGGTYFFLEHVAAPDGTRTRAAQRILKRPHRWMFNGCEVDRDTESVIRSAGFTTVDIHHVDTGMKGGHVRHFVVGTAIR